MKHGHKNVKLKKEYSYTSTPPLGLRGLFWADLYLTLTQVLPIKANPTKKNAYFTVHRIDLKWKVKSPETCSAD